MAKKKKIDTELFKKILKLLGFNESSNVYKSEVGGSKYLIQVDFNKEKINYGSVIKINSGEVCNFAQPENIVMLECVIRLLKQGYSPKCIELEPLWPRGTGRAKGDILIRDMHHKAYLLVECKTFGREFDGHWKKTLNDGDQLFDYYQQDTNTKYLVMYASQLNTTNNTIEYIYHLITVKDNDAYLNIYFGKSAKGYRDAKNKDEAYNTWKNVYKLDYSDIGLFEDCLPYGIGEGGFTTNNLKEITSNLMYETDKEFKNTLRQHNVGSHENAFDKLVNLFLAKIVDEKNNPKNLQFNWRGVTKDNIKSLMDRLQKLYKQGMKTFLNEDVTYVEKKDVDNAFRYFNDPLDAVKITVNEYFDALKYYTNNDFAFIDVHNEKLFKQNAEILLRVVSMLQNLKLTTKNHNQFLGDLFEGFLDNGVKQSEGQYFTPLPIVRFIVSSLPLKSMINAHSETLKMIDYACGAGHFLNEYAKQISDFVTDDSKRKEFYKNIWGIEKEYRLSKVSKVSAFMYSQDEINIVCDDALKHNDRIKDETFDVLIANPPYSVKGFLETLDENDRNRYELYKNFDKKKNATNRRIELFFVERAKQLLDSDANAAIILPAAFLDNPGIHIKAREILLKSFDIIAIVEFAGGTFGKTEVPTITLFLRRKKKHPNVSDFVETRIRAWYSKDFKNEKLFKDGYILEQFCKSKSISISKFKSDPTEFENLRDKLYYFYLAKTQLNKVLIVKSPMAKKELKQFLGYEWETRNKSYKISYLGAVKPKLEDDDDEEEDTVISSEEGIEKIKTPLFNPKNLYNDEEKINKLIRDNFDGKPIIIPDNLSDYVQLVSLEELIRFSGKNDKNLQISTTAPFKMKSKYDLKPLNKIAKINKSKQIQASELENLIDNSSTEVKLLPSSKDYNWWTTKAKAKPFLQTGEVIAIGQARYANIKYHNGRYVSANNIIISSLDEKKNKTKFLYHLFSIYSKHFYKRTGMYPAFNRDLFENFEMPDVPYALQSKIISECDKVDGKVKDYENQINKINDEIMTKITKSNTKKYKINFNTDLEINLGRRVTENELDTKGDLPVISTNIYNIFGWINKKSIIDNFDSGFVLWSLDGDWMTRYMPPNKPFYPTDHCGYIKVINKANINAKYLTYILEEAGKNERFSRSKRPNTDKIIALDLRLPDIAEQNRVIDEIEPMVEKINVLHEKIKNLSNEKSDIMNKYLL